MLASGSLKYSVLSKDMIDIVSPDGRCLLVSENFWKNICRNFPIIEKDFAAEHENGMYLLNSTLQHAFAITSFPEFFDKESYADAVYLLKNTCPHDWMMFSGEKIDPKESITLRREEFFKIHANDVVSFCGEKMNDGYLMCGRKGKSFLDSEEDYAFLISNERFEDYYSEFGIVFNPKKDYMLPIDYNTALGILLDNPDITRKEMIHAVSKSEHTVFWDKRRDKFNESLIDIQKEKKSDLRKNSNFSPTM